MRVQSTVPVGKGLGSSGALSTALMAALLQYTAPGEAPPLESIGAAALRCETHFHGRTSGIDVAVSTHGGTRAFQDGASRPVASVTEGFNVVLVDTGVPRNSRDMIARAKGSLAAMGDAERAALLATLEASVQELLQRGTAASLPAQLPVFQGFLELVGVSHPAIDGCIRVLREQWGIPAKLTGAGGGGFLYALFPRGLLHSVRLRQVRAALQSDPRTKAYAYQLIDMEGARGGVSVRYTCD